MLAFWDTSAIVPLLLSETSSGDAALAHAQCTEMYAWTWLRVEAEAALLRRGALRKTREMLGEQLEFFHWIDLPKEEFPAVTQFNAGIGLRAADAGHLYCFSRLAEALPEIVLVSFDSEMIAAAKKRKFRVWTASTRMR